MIKQAFILAAGLGNRMKPVTDKIPKPIIEIDRKSIITRAIDQLISYGVEKIVINSFYKSDLLHQHIETYITTKNITREIKLIEEHELLDTGGGILNGLSELNDEPFFIVNGDSIWEKHNPFSYLANKWDDKMKMLFMLIETDKAVGYDGKGDFALDANHMLMKPLLNPDSYARLPYAYVGIHITRPEIFANYQGTIKCKLMDIYNKLKINDMYQDTYGAIYDGYWFHIGTPEAIKVTENRLRELP